MQNLWNLLPYLICPLAMGGAMWLLMRTSRGPAPDGGQQVVQQGAVDPPAGRPAAPPPGPADRGLRLGPICLNWRVVGGLALIGGGVWVLAPNLMWAALPVLLMAACPLSMLFMMRDMPGSQCATPAEQTRPLAGGHQAPEERIVALQAALARSRAEQEELARELARLEAAQTRPLDRAEGSAPASSERAQAGS